MFIPLILVEQKEKKLTNNVPIKKLLIGFFILIILVFLAFFHTNIFLIEKISYNQGTVNTINDYTVSEDLKTNNTTADANIIKISLMNFKNQSKVFDDRNINNLLEKIQLTISEKGTLEAVKSPEGSENLNPPEVMLIATEANSSFVVNGLIFDENQKIYLTIKSL